MSATHTQNASIIQTQTPNIRGKGGKSRRGRSASQSKAVAAVIDKMPTEQKPAQDSDLCWICASNVKYYSLSACSHRTCHVCALRLRALYKKDECAFCKEAQPTVIFTLSPDKPYHTLSQPDAALRDNKLGIVFESKEMMEEVLMLLHFNCPCTLDDEASCDFRGTGWADLKMHVRAVHNKLMCDLCIRWKKVFAHEHLVYSYPALVAHMPSMGRGKNKANGDGEDVHPLCEFCLECLFGDDELFAHMRERHEECFLCKRSGIRDLYFQNYQRLDAHFTSAHHPCTQPTCKGVVFGTVMDLKAHMVGEHGREMDRRERREMGRVEVEFEEFGRGRNERAPPPGRRAFASRLTTSAAPTPVVTPPARSTPPRRASPSPPREPQDPAILEKHNAFLARLQNYTSNPAAVRGAIRAYKASENSARDVISTIWEVVDHSLEGTASLVNAFVDLLDSDADKDKREAVLAAWRGFEVEQRQQFPDLVPTGVGSGYAGIASGRLLNAAQQKQVLDRVARAASSAKFPPLNGFGPAHKQTQHKTAWSASGSGSAPAASSSYRPLSQSIPVIRSVPSSTSSSGPPPPKLNDALFPGLPSAAPKGPKPQIGGNASLRNILGSSGVVKPTVWGATDVTSGEDTGNSVENEGEGGGGTKRKKKGKGKQKETLFTFGNFPS